MQESASNAIKLYEKVRPGEASPFQKMSAFEEAP